jgi:hypothetical protein
MEGGQVSDKNERAEGVADRQGAREKRERRPRRPIPMCECYDLGCYEHPGEDRCYRIARTTLFLARIHDSTGTRFCGKCQIVAEASGRFKPRGDK